MKNKIALTIIVLLMSVAMIASESIAISLKVKGDVNILRKEETLTANTGDHLFNKDVIESKQESFAAVKFVDASSIVKLFPNSILTITAEKENGKLNKKSTLEIGDLWTKVTKKTGKFEVDTPTTVVSVKGTEFVLSVNKKGETNLSTLKGEVKMRNKKDGKEATIGKGQKAHSTGSGDINVTAMSKDDLEDSIREEIEEGEEKSLEIQLENDEGDIKTIELKFD